MKEKARGRVREPGKMNATERRYAEVLEQRRLAGEVLWWKFEAIAFRLAAERCFYHPDFIVMLADCSINIDEVKGGFIRDDGRDKLKIAAALFPLFTFRRCQWVDGAWKITEIGGDRDTPTKAEPRREEPVRTLPVRRAQTGRTALVNGKPVPYRDALALIQNQK